MKILIDTCIIMDYFEKRSQGFTEADIIFKSIHDRKIIGCISVKTIMDIHYLVKHIKHSEKDSRTAIKLLFDMCEILDSKMIDAYTALNSNISDYEDALMVETALNNDVDYIVTRDNDYKECKIAITPKQFINLLK